MRLLCFLLTLLSVAVSSVAQDIEVGTFSYRLGREGNNVVLSKGHAGGIVNIPDSITYRNRNFKVMAIASEAFYDKKISTLHIPKNITYIGSEAFWRSHINTLIIDEGIDRIGENAFASNDFTELIIPNSVTRLDDCSFSWCENLKRIVLGSNMEAIHWGSFNHCNKIEEIICYAVEPPYIYVSEIDNYGKPIFTNEVYQFATLRVPNESIEKYKKSKLWGSFREIVPIE